MDLLLALSHVAVYLLLALALVLPRLRRAAVLLLAAAAVATLGAGFRQDGVAPDGTRSLTTVHSYAGYEGPAVEISMVPFPTGTFTAPAWQWPLPFVGFAALWLLLLWALGSRAPKNPWVLPLLFAWSAMAAWLGMQVLAAPADYVQPIGLDRFLWPAGLALALLAARRAKGVFPLLLMVGGGTLAMRLPAALFSVYASEHALGTCLDIHTIRDIVNPMTRMQFQPRIAAGSAEQQFWLIWLEHIIFFPAVYLMSLFGVAFGAHMFHRHGPETDA